MYTGIVQATCELSFVERKPNLMQFGLCLPIALSADVTLGASIAVNGCCFTVTSMTPSVQGLDVTFDAIDETQAITNVKHFEEGSVVNVERSAKQNARWAGMYFLGISLVRQRSSASKEKRTGAG